VLAAGRVDNAAIGDIPADAALTVQFLVLQQYMRHVHHIRAVHAYQVPVVVVLAVVERHVSRSQPLRLGRRAQVGRDQGARFDLFDRQSSASEQFPRE